MIFSPRKVLVVCGDNKIVPDVDAALKQISKVAAPMNARRHYLKHGESNCFALPLSSAPTATAQGVSATSLWSLSSRGYLTCIGKPRITVILTD
jgi:hypothetical protein